MSYPFVASAHDAGLRKGPIRGFLVHMAEGGGTVGYLAKPNPNGVSVHYVIEYSGRTVQMLLESHMHTSIRIGTGGVSIRQDTGADGFGYAVARAVLGDWATIATTLGPNHSTIAVEVEGFAANGPNPAQAVALAKLAIDVAARNPTIRGNTGHRDHNVKTCPGALIPWAALGGHGLYDSLTSPEPTPEPEAPMVNVKCLGPALGTVSFPAGHQLINPADVAIRFPGPGATYDFDQVLTVYGQVDLATADGTPMDVSGNSPAQGGRDQCWLVQNPGFGVAALALRQDCGPLVSAGLPTATTYQLSATTAPDGQSVVVTLRGS